MTDKQTIISKTEKELNLHATSFIDEETCCSCIIGVSNLVSFNKALKEELEKQEKFYDEMFEYKSEHEYYYYDFFKHWTRKYQFLKNIRIHIDEGGTIESVKKLFNREV